MSARSRRPTGSGDGQRASSPGRRGATPPGQPDPIIPPPPPVDPRAVRATIALATRSDDDPTMTVTPPPVPVVRPMEHLAGTAILGGVPSPKATPPDGDDRSRRRATRAAAGGDPGWPDELMVDGELRRAGITPLGREHVVLVEVEVEGGRSVDTRLVIGPERRREVDGVVVREVVVDGWRVEVELEPERRASLRERARRASDVAGRSGPVEVHAIIPGRIVALSVAPGDAVVAGQQLLVLEAMKMQNELRAPREGSIERIPIAVGENVEVGDLLMVIT